MEAKKQNKVGTRKNFTRGGKRKTDDRIINEFYLFFTDFLRRKDITVKARSDTVQGKSTEGVNDIIRLTGEAELLKIIDVLFGVMVWVGGRGRGRK